MANCPAVITCTDVMANDHPDLVIAYMKAMIKVGRWANEHKHAAAVILNRQTFYRDVEDTYQGIKGVDMVPNLSPRNLAAVEIGRLRRAPMGPRPSSWRRPPKNCWKRSGSRSPPSSCRPPPSWSSASPASGSRRSGIPPPPSAKTADLTGRTHQEWPGRAAGRPGHPLAAVTTRKGE